MLGGAMYIYVIRPARPARLTEGPTAEEQAVLATHVAYIQQLLESGRLVLAGRTTDNGPATFGIVMFHARDMQEARQTMENDPPVRAGVFTGEVYPYSIAFKSFAPAEPPLDA